MADEFNKIEVNNGYSPDGQNKLSTASYVHEENKFSGNAKQPEINKREAPLSVAKKIKKNTRFTGLIIKAVAVVAAAVVGVVEVENLLPADYKVELFVEAGEDFVSYFAEFGEYSPENNEITVSVYNDFTKREKKFELSEGEERFHGVDGFEENLQSDMKYTIEVLDGRKTVAKETFRTAKQLQERLEFDIDFVEIGEFSAFYVGNLGNYVPDNSYLTAIITGGDLRDETILQMIDGERRIEGIFENLSPDTYYTVEIFDGSRVVARNSFRTTEETFVNAFELAIEAMENGVFFSASLGGYENVNEFFNVRIYNANDESDSYGSECEVISEEVERYIQGEIFDLSPDTEYIIEIYDGEVLVCRDSFRTQEQSPWFDISVDADGSSAAFYAYLSDYEPTGDLKIVVESDGETIGEASAQMKGGELAAYIEGLSPLTYYMATLYDGDIIIGETSFETEYLVDIQFDLEVSNEESTVYYYAELGDYSPKNNNFTIKVYNSEKVAVYTGECEIEIDSSSNKYITGEIYDLTDYTEYTVDIIDGDTVVARGTFTPEIFFDIEVDAQSDSATYYVNVGSYTPTDELKFVTTTADGGPADEIYAQIDEKGTITATTVNALSPSSYYTVTLYDGNNVIGETYFETQVRLQLTLSAGENYVNFSADLGNYSNVNDTFTVTVYIGSQVIASKETQVVRSRINDIIEGLAYETHYTIQVKDGETLIAEDEFTTTEQTTFALTLNVSEGETFASFTTELGNYQPQNEAFGYVVTDSTGETVSSGNVDTQAAGAAGGPISWRVTDLSPDTEYTITVTDGNVTVAKTKFTTLFVNVIELNLEAGYDSLGFSAHISDYQPESQSFTVVVYNDGERKEVECELSQSAVAQGYTLSGSVEGLTAGTDYYIEVYDGQTVIYKGSFRTEEA